MANLHLLSIKNCAAWIPPLPALENSATAFTTIPANLKRRCSHLIKIALETANQATGSHQIDYAVFCSQHGELKSAVGLLQDISKRLPLSPAIFSQSVHNTVAGLFCVIHRLHINTISIAARNDTFFMGVLEAVTWLKLNPGKTVLLTVFDELIPKEYGIINTKKLNVDPNHEYAVAILLTDKLTTQTPISFTLAQNQKQNPDENLPLALEFLQWYLKPIANELIQNTNHYTTRWRKN